MDDEILQEFVVESVEALDRLDVELVELEQDPSDATTLSSIFRRVHTIKGTCGFLGFPTLESITHTGESLLCRLRDGELTATPQIVSALLDLVDAIREVMDRIVATGDEGSTSYDALVARLAALTADQPTAEPSPPADDLGSVATTTEQPATTTEDADGTAGGTPRIGDLLVQAGAVQRQDVERALACQADGDPRHVGEILIAWGLVTPDQTLEVLQAQKARAAASPAMADSSVRVDVGLLDTLMNLVGELVLNRNQILQHARVTTDAALATPLQRLDQITTELQSSVMKTRMQPIESAWSKFPRLVRDLARQCDKEVRLEMHGKDTELDKTLLEAIKDPLTHVVRNAIDHGIEAPATREELGKDRQGSLTLRASHESGQVVIEVADDGAGIDPHRIRDLAVARGVVTAWRAERLSTREMTELVFAPGFSTADSVSTISGRGVGMDVVRTNIAEIGGTVDLSSEHGVGTTLRVTIPLTLAIIPALVVAVGPDLFAIPQVALLELVRLDGAHRVESVHGAPVFRLRDRLLPLLYLNQQLAGQDVPPRGDHIVVVKAGDRVFGLVVDRVDDTSEIVVKPLGRSLRDIGLFAGATIMGDGTVALILDVPGLAAHAGLGEEAAEMLRDPADPLDEVTDAEARTLLLFRLASSRTFAMELAQVARLEEFDQAAVERSGMHDVVQYRGRILQLSHVADVLEPGMRPRTAEGQPVRAIVYEAGETDVGLVVGEITDIVDRHLTVERDLDVPGLAGSTVIDGVVVDVVDVDGLLAGLGMVAAAGEVGR